MSLTLTAPGHASAPALRLLSGLVLDLAAATSVWQPLVRFDAVERLTVRLPGPPGVEVWLGTWLPGQSSDLHDHGSASAALTVVRGALVERSPGPDGTALPVRFALGDVAALGAGQRHTVTNEDAVPAVSIHVRTTAVKRRS